MIKHPVFRLWRVKDPSPTGYLESHMRLKHLPLPIIHPAHIIFLWNINYKYILTDSFSHIYYIYLKLTNHIQLTKLDTYHLVNYHQPSLEEELGTNSVDRPFDRPVYNRPTRKPTVYLQEDVPQGSTFDDEDGPFYDQSPNISGKWEY